MPATAVADRFERHLVENWTATPIIPYDTIAEPPADVPAFLVQQYPVVLGEQQFLGRHYHERGTYRLVLNVRRGIGFRQGCLWQDELINLFRDFRFGDIALQTVGVPDGAIIDDNSELGDWIVYSILVEYLYQYDAAIPTTIVAAAGFAGGSGT